MAREIRDKLVEELVDLLQKRDGERQAIVLQDFPDPDAISCAFAYRTIAEAFGIESDILYAGRISHQENIALIHLLGIDLLWWDRDKPIPRGRYQSAVCVDNQGTTSALTELIEAAEVPFLVVIDHHADQERLHPVFMDVRPAIGSCAAILSYYLAEGALPLKMAKPEHRKLATALMHGIVSDTGSMIHASALDFASAAYLQPFVYPDMLVEILHQQRSHKVMEVIQVALANRIVRENFCFSGVGYLRADERDAIPQAADFLLTEETVHTVVVYGIVINADGDETIHGSLRTTKNTLSPDVFLKEVLGRSEDGGYYGGGKAMAGGFEIRLGFLSGHDDSELASIKWETFDRKIRRKFFAKIGIDEEG
ncbi:MAG: bifunctional oligoribonuclease/PAP phosphatase NrnA [Magnetococcales bacterium]|nr:bifunctional oligoribonuclease/PAP phosphatase NrnA [Magnetococcales bacterium]